MHPLFAEAELRPCDEKNRNNDDHGDGTCSTKLEELQTLLPEEIEKI